MNIKKKIITFILTFSMVLSLVPMLSVQASTTDFKIVSDSNVTGKQAKEWAKSKGATETFQNLAELYFEYSSDCGDVNPAIAYVQAAKETGYGNFGGVLDESYKNPCGLKTASGGGDTDKYAHQKFDSWDKGVQAHMDHLALYAGADGYPKDKDNTYDPRNFVTIKGTATTVNSLGTKWAPSATYGEEVNALYKSLMDFAGVEYEKDQDDSKNNDNGDKNKENTKSSTTNNEKTNNSSHSKKVIAIDAGHDYGKDYGAESPINGVTYSETELNMQVASKLKVELENKGFNVVMTRQDGEKPESSSLSVSLTDKVKVANDADADLFISIHHNSASATAKGVETYYSVQPKDANYGGGIDLVRLEKSKEMAKAINDSIANKIAAINRGAKSDASSDVGTLFILRNANMPAVLVETGFITNSEEAIRCADSVSQQMVAEAIADAIFENI